jgi:hypothetical protein
VAETMIPNFPLNVFRDKKVEIPNTNVPPHKTIQEIVEGEPNAARQGMVHGRTRISSAIWESKSPDSADKACCCSDNSWPRWACAKGWK